MKPYVADSDLSQICYDKIDKKHCKKKKSRKHYKSCLRSFKKGRRQKDKQCDIYAERHNGFLIFHI